MGVACGMGCGGLKPTPTVPTTDPGTGTDSSSGTAGGTFAILRTRGGLELRKELERATCDVLGNMPPPPGATPPPDTLFSIMLLLLLFKDVVSALLLL